MAKNKTTATTASVAGFIDQVPDETKRKDSAVLMKLMKKITGQEAYMYGPTIVGFGNYHYKYESGHEGDAPLTAFSPRKDAFSIYLSTGFEGKDELLAQLGKHKTGKGCLYVKKLADIDMDILEQMIIRSVKEVKKSYPG